jgi:hypothetical protein
LITYFILTDIDDWSIANEDRLSFLNSVTRIIQLDSSIVDGNSQEFKIVVDNLILSLNDDSVMICELSREILRDLIKNYKKFLDIIPKLSFVNRQDLLYVIGKTDVLFRTSMNFSNYNSIKSQTIYRQAAMTAGSDVYKSENMSTQLPDSSTYKGPNNLNDRPNIKPKIGSKKWFGIIPNKLIKDLETNNAYDDRIRALSEISQNYVHDASNFLILSKKINEFIVYIFGLSKEENDTDDELIAYEAISMVHDILTKDIKIISKMKYNLVFSNLIDHFKTQDISLLNEVILVFKQLKYLLGTIEYSNSLHVYFEIPNHSHIREILDIYTMIFDDLPKLPKGFDYESSIRGLCKVSHNKQQAVRTTSVRWLDKILTLIEFEDQECMDKVR